jgi:prevent-host-death family protein
MTEPRAHIFRLLRKLQENGGEIIVTDNGRPVLRILPYEEEKPEEQPREGRTLKS